MENNITFIAYYIPF